MESKLKNITWDNAETFLVTGGGGFIGSHLIRELVNQGRKVVAFDSHPDASYISDCMDKVKFVYGSVADMPQLISVMADFKVKAVFHLGYMLVPDTDNQTARAIQTNCAGFQNVMEAARILGIRRVVWASSQAVYGTADGYSSSPIVEDVHVNPATQYGACKLFNEHVARYYREYSGVDNIGLRKPVVYGLGKSRRRDLSISHRLIENAVLGKPVDLPPGDFRANYVYVKDVVRAYILAMQAPKTEHSIFNIIGYVYRCSEVVDVLRGIFPALVVNNVKSLNSPNPIDAYDMSPVRAKEEIGYEPVYPLREAVLDFIKTKQELGTQYEASQCEYDVVKLI
jgi:nucleoside-diphosphate-sugar epimerase